MAPHGLCPGAQILTIRPLAVSSVPATAQSLLLLLVPGRHAGVVAAARAAQCVPAFQHVCCCNYSLGCALGALRATIPVCAFCLTVSRLCAGETVEAGCSAHCRHGSSRCCKERQLAEDTCWRRHAG